MSHYAIHDGSQVLTVIVADSAETASTLTGLQAVKSVDGKPWTGWTLNGDEWRPPMPSEGVWEWDVNAAEWVEITSEPDTE